MQSIWRIAIVILVVCSTPVSKAQNSASKQYFNDNILKLDPIEGIWEVEDYMYVQSGSFSNSKTSTTTVEIKRQSDNKFKVNGSNIWFERIGETNAYTLSYYSDIENTKKSLQIVLESNGFSFYYKTKEQPDRRSFRTDTYSYIKSYPSISMYEAALRKAHEAEQQAIENAQPKSWTGTGFALLNNYIVTNYHVIENAKSISIQGIKGNFNTKYHASVIATDKSNDLALLRVNGTSLSTGSIPYSIKTITSDVGEDVFVLGYPLTSTMGDEIKLTTGVVSSKSGFQGDVSQYQISAPIQPGNSGGPLFDSKGDVIGIVSAKHKGAENVGYAIKASYLRNLMESALPTNILPQSNKISNLRLSGKVKAVKDFVYYITCSNDTEANVSHQDSMRNKNNNSENSRYNSNLDDSDNLTFTVNGISFTMIHVKGGTFKMGATSEQENEAFSDERPVHNVTVSDYYIGQTEVTIGLVRAVIGNIDMNADNLMKPLGDYSWQDCQEWIQKLNTLTGKKFRLPTEAEWEFAARGGNKSNNYKYSGSNSLVEVGWYWKNSGDFFLDGTDEDWRLGRVNTRDNNCRVHNVGEKEPNELGIYDMSGNEEEWCQDGFNNYQSSAQTNPCSAINTKGYVIRSGSFGAGARGCRVSSRHGSSKYSRCGFRLALSL